LTASSATHPSAPLACPKCQAPMRSYERSGITIDQCTECRGVFLDRGELERVIDAEEGSRRDRDERVDDRDGRPHEGDHRRKRRGGFLGELFD
jgi:uncharacterized protein